MKIPTKVIFYGDRDRCQSVLGIARSRMFLLHERLKRSNGMIKQGWQRPITLITGEVVRLAVSFNTSVIEIIAGVSQPGENFNLIEEEQKCFCDCNLSLGIITKIDEELKQSIQWIDLIACNHETIYVGYENIIPSDFTRYEEGQKVILMAYYDFLYDCKNKVFSATGCDPKKSASELEDDSWRATYRIIPLCALTIPKWI